MQAANQRLVSESLNELAVLYQAGRANAILQSVQKWNKSRKCLYVLLRAEGVLVNTLIELAALGSLPKDSKRGGWLRSKRSGDFNFAACIREPISRGLPLNCWMLPRRLCQRRKKLFNKSQAPQSSRRLAVFFEQPDVDGGLLMAPHQRDAIRRGGELENPAQRSRSFEVPALNPVSCRNEAANCGVSMGMDTTLVSFQFSLAIFRAAASQCVQVGS